MFKSLFSQNYSQNFSHSYTVQSLNPQGGDSSSSSSTSRWMGNSWDNTLTYNNKFGDLHVNALVGGNLTNGQWNSFRAARSGYPEGDPEALRYLNFGDASTQTNSESRITSYNVCYTKLLRNETGCWLFL